MQVDAWVWGMAVVERSKHVVVFGKDSVGVWDRVCVCAYLSPCMQMCSCFFLKKNQRDFVIVSS